MTTIDVLSKLGPFISGIGMFAIAFAAWITLFVINRRALQMSWLDGFQKLYADFWDDEEIAIVRSWIASDIIYKGIESILIERLKTDNNLLDSKSYSAIDKIDKFCSLLVRMNFFNETGMTSAQRNLWQATYGAFWINKIAEREALALYIRKYWPASVYGENRK
jgi:hypothetical protein